MGQCVFIALNFESPQAAFGILQGTAKQLKQVGFSQRTQLEDLRTRNQRRIDEEKRIMGGRAYQPYRAAFDVGQQNVLLRFVEAVNLVNKQDGWLAGIREPIRGRGK